MYQETFVNLLCSPGEGERAREREGGRGADGGWVGNVDNPSPPYKNIIVFYLLQGSYGIVKLAYNEEDDTHYVSISTTEI